MWRSDDGALLWDAATQPSSSLSGAPAAAAASAAVGLEGGRLVAVLARSSVSVYAAASGALAWAFTSAALDAAATGSGAATAAAVWSDLAAAGPGRACALGLTAKGQLALVDVHQGAAGAGTGRAPSRL